MQVTQKHIDNELVSQFNVMRFEEEIMGAGSQGVFQMEDQQSQEKSNDSSGSDNVCHSDKLNT